MAERARKAGLSQMHARTGPAMQQADTNGRPPQGPTVAAVYWMLSRATVAAAHMLPSQHEARWPQRRSRGSRCSRGARWLNGLLSGRPQQFCVRLEAVHCRTLRSTTASQRHNRCAGILGQQFNVAA